MHDRLTREESTPWYDAITLWVLASLAFHFLLFALWGALPSDWLHFIPSVPVDQEPPTLTMIEMSQAPPELQENSPKRNMFIPTDPSQEVAQENPNAVLESEHNTRLRSPERGTERNSAIPQLSGDPRAAISYQESPRIQPSKTAPQPSTPERSRPPAPEEKPTLQHPPEKPTERQELPEEGVPVIPQANPQQPPPRPPTPRSQNPTKPSESPAAPTMSFARERSQMNGSSRSEIGNASPESKATEMGRYKAKMYRAIGSRWYLMVEEQKSLLAIGSLKIKFYVQANGVIRDFQVVEASGRTEILEKISLQSIRASGPFEPFSDSMKQQMGVGYWEDITFAIY